jgi:hypothetical protein
MNAMPTDREKLVRDMDLALTKGGLSAVLTVGEEAFVRPLEQFGASGGEGNPFCEGTVCGYNAAVADIVAYIRERGVAG